MTQKQYKRSENVLAVCEQEKNIETQLSDTTQ